MADKRRVRKSIKELQRIKTWQLLILLILMSVLTLTFLRLNNINMIERRTAVLNADKAGDVTSVRNNLYALQRFASSHMNADPGPIYLQGQYDRDSKKAVEATQTQNEGSTVYQVADQTCKAQNPQWVAWSPQYVECVNAALAKLPSENILPKATLPDPALYRFDYVSPSWSPDFAGWSIVASGIVVIMIISRFVSLIILRALLRRHYKSI